MTICPNSKHACRCQPQEGVMCPHGPTPKDWPGVAENIDAERAAFNEWFDETMYRETARDAMEAAWLAARRTPSASIGENGLPALSDAVQSVIACARRVHAKFGTESDWSEWRDLGDALAEFDAAPPLSSEQQAEKGKI